MDHIRGTNRSEVQLIPPTIDDYVSADAPVRFIDAFVNSLNLVELGFTHAHCARTGRPPYNPATLLKLYLYGYLHRIRTTRRLEAETHRNLEVIWLLQGLHPDFKTISNFRSRNRKRFKAVFRDFNLLCRRMGLFGAQLVAIDGTKFKAVSNPRDHHTTKQLKKAIELVEKQIEAYLKQLDQADVEGAPISESDSPTGLKEKLARIQEHREDLAKTLKVLQKSEKPEIGGNDPEARKMKVSKAPSVGYNVQIGVDAKNHLIVAQEVVQDANDENQLQPMSEATHQELAPEKPEIVADSGYHNFEHIDQCETQGIVTYVTRPKTTSGRGKNGRVIFKKERFEYNREQDYYRCPGDKELKLVREREKDGKSIRVYENKAACASCPLKEECTTGKLRSIERHWGQAAVDRLAQRTRENPQILSQRKATVEHVFGTLRMWGHDRFVMRGLEKVRAEISLSAMSYNLRRAINVVGVKGLLKALAQS